MNAEVLLQLLGLLAHPLLQACLLRKILTYQACLGGLLLELQTGKKVAVQRKPIVALASHLLMLR